MGNNPAEAVTGWTWAYPAAALAFLILCVAGALLTRRRPRR